MCSGSAGADKGRVLGTQEDTDIPGGFSSPAAGSWQRYLRSICPWMAKGFWQLSLKVRLWVQAAPGQSHSQEELGDVPHAQCAALLVLPGLAWALTSQINPKDGEKVSSKLGHSHKRNSQSQTIGFCQQKDLAGGCFVRIYFNTV